MGMKALLLSLKAPYEDYGNLIQREIRKLILN